MSAWPAPGFNSSMLAQMSLEELRQLEREMVHNFSYSVNEAEFDLLRSTVWRALVLTLYVTIILVGTVGNVTVVYVVARHRKMHNVTNVLIANLALSDVGLCVFSLPIQLYYQITDSWIFGDLLCRLMFSAFAVPVYVSTLTILLIAYDRYWLIVYPLKERMSLKTAFVLLLLTSVTSVLLSTPVMCFANLQPVNHPDLRIDRKYCIEVWPNEVARKIYSSLTFSFQFCFPLFVTALLYWKIYLRLRRRPTNRFNAERKQRTNNILISIVALFIICWLPWNVFSLVTELQPNLVRGRHFKFVDLMLKGFAMSSACVNPYLYCWLNENFRKELDNMAVKMHIYSRDVSQRTHHGDHSAYAPHTAAPTTEENGRTQLLTDPFGTITIERLSRVSSTNLI